MPARRPPSAEKPPHPADVRRAAVLASPAGYSATMRANGRNNTVPCATLVQAAIAATGLELAAQAAYGATARAIVYALPRDGGGPEVVAVAEWRGLVSPAQIETARATIARNLAQGAKA